MIFCINGRFIDETENAISLSDNGFLYGDGFYNSMRSYNGILLEPKLHLERLFHSSQVLDIPLPWSGDEILSWAEQIVTRNHLKDARVRLTVTRGVHGFDFHGSKKPTLTIVCSHIEDDPVLRKGVKAATMRLQRILPEIKTIGLTSMFVANRRAEELGVYEMIFLGEGDMVREGTSTNVFIVKNGVLRTPKSQILEGLTRACVLDFASENGIKAVTEDFPLKDLEEADEIFITNGLIEIVPILTLNGHAVGKGVIGEQTKALMKMYAAYVAEKTKR